jgi:hypothetical protein
MISLNAAALRPGEDGHAAVYALLRHAVARRCGTPCPAIARAADGKPYFPARDDLFFSLSHTKTHVLAALSDHDVGADIETRRAVSDRLRDRLFTPQEQRDFEFFEGWTLREAVFKLTGASGLLRMPLAREGDVIVTPFPDVFCRCYDDVPGCAVSLASREADFPSAVALVPPEALWA